MIEIDIPEQATMYNNKLNYFILEEEMMNLSLKVNVRLIF